MKKNALLILVLCAALKLEAQLADTTSLLLHADTIRRISLQTQTHDFTTRQKAVGISLLGASGGTLLLLNKAWYQQYARTNFHIFNDGREWLQVDKAGHAWSAYQLSRSTAALWKWAGINEQKSVILGSSGSLLFLSIIELMDGYSQKWGWSWADMAANGSGVALFAAQELGWKQQRIALKFSARTQRSDPSLAKRKKELFGVSFPEELLKDYNNQTYWLSVNLKSFMPRSTLPPWLNVAVGYGATGMWGGFENRAFDAGGNLVFDRTDITRNRQWYLSPDVDLTKIKTNRSGVRTILFLLNCVKFPVPALELSKQKLKIGWVQ